MNISNHQYDFNQQITILYNIITPLYSTINKKHMETKIKIKNIALLTCPTSSSSSNAETIDKAQHSIVDQTANQVDSTRAASIFTLPMTEDETLSSPSSKTRLKTSSNGTLFLVWGHPFMTSTKKIMFLTPPSPLSTWARPLPPLVDVHTRST